MAAETQRSRTLPRSARRCWAAALSRACRSARCNCRSAAHPSTSCRDAPFRSASAAPRWPTPRAVSEDQAACLEQMLKRQSRPRAGMRAVLGRRNSSKSPSQAVLHVMACGAARRVSLAARPQLAKRSDRAMPSVGNETAGSDFSFATADRQFPTLLLRLAFGMSFGPASLEPGWVKPGSSRCIENQPGHCVVDHAISSMNQPGDLCHGFDKLGPDGVRGVVADHLRRAAFGPILERLTGGMRDGGTAPYCPVGG